MVGILNTYKTNADQVFANATLASLNLGGTGGIDIAANQTKRVRFWIKFSVGATGGVRLQAVVPAGSTIYSATIALVDSVTPAYLPAVRQASTVYTNALAVAGTHWFEVNLFLVNGATAGKIDLQMAQNTTDALTLTVLRGATAEAITL